MGKGRIFVDTSAWYALQVTDDVCHQKAKEIFSHLFGKYHSFLTSNHIIGETYTLLRTSKGYQEASRFLDILRGGTDKTCFAREINAWGCFTGKLRLARVTRRSHADRSAHSFALGLPSDITLRFCPCLRPVLLLMYSIH